jgi:hypothetical protein
MEDNTQQQEQAVAPAAPVTEVTSIAKEEEKTGQKIDVPSAEELVARASSSVIANLQALRRIIHARQGTGYTVSRKGMNRIMEAIFDLPTEGQTVMLQGKDEKMAFILGQNLMRNMFILTQHHINEEIRKRKEAELNQKQEETKPSEGETNEPGKQ